MEESMKAADMKGKNMEKGLLSIQTAELAETFGDMEK